MRLTKLAINELGTVNLNFETNALKQKKTEIT